MLKKIYSVTYCCDFKDGVHGINCKYRYVLWAVLLINISLFFTEFSSGIYSGSQALIADALDFFGDSVNYIITLFVLNSALATRAKASLFKGGTMGILGVWVIVSTLYKIFITGLPQAEIMGLIGFLAMIGNLLSALLLYKFRSGDSNRESAWICSRNDAISNIAVIIAGLFVYLTNSKYPDLIVAGIMAYLAITGARRIIISAAKELRKTPS